MPFGISTQLVIGVLIGVALYWAYCNYKGMKKN